jgi:HK97 family phage major capsid protein
MKFSRITAGGLVLLVALLFAGLAFIAGDPTHALNFDWHAIAGGGLMLATAPVAVAEQIALFDTRRKAAVDRAEAIMQKSAEEGRTLDERETEEYDTLGSEVKAIDAHLVRLKAHEANLVQRATPVAVTTGAPEGVTPPAGTSVISVRRNVEPGIAFARYAKAVALAKGNPMHAAHIASQWRESTPEVEAFIKAALASNVSLEQMITRAAVAAGTTSDSTWAGPLVYAQNMVSEFINYLRPRTILGRLPSLRRVPFNIRIQRQTSGVSGSWVGEGAPTPVNALAFDTVSLTWARASTIVVLTKELVERSDPAADALAREDLADGISAFLDKRFLDPSYPAVANTSPASISNGVTSRQASGTSLTAIDNDVTYLMTQFVNAELTLQTGIWIMKPATAIRLSMMRNAHGDRAFPELTMNGGTWYGLPVITSNNVASSGSPGEEQIFLVDQREILLADDGQMMLDMSTEASVQMNDAPSAGAQSLVSFWQNGLLGVKIDRWINWTKRRSQACQYIEYANRYGS